MPTPKTTATTTTSKENTMKKSTAHQNATAAHAAAVEKAAEVAALLQATEADLSALESVDAAQLLADPAKAVQVAEGRAKLAQLHRIHSEMLGAARQAERDAARAVVALEAEEMAPAVAAAEADLEKWQAREAELLDALEAHTNLRYVRPEREPGAAWLGGVVSFKAPSDSSIKARVRLLKAQQAALVAASEGRDPAEVCELDALPDSLKPGGILPSPYAVDRAARDAQRAAEEAESAASNAEDAARLQGACQRLGIDPAQVDLLDHWQRAGEGTVGSWRQQTELSLTLQFPGEDIAHLRDALVVLAELAGTDVANTLLTRLQPKQAEPEPAAS